jgi:hypothetical protein
MLRIIITVLVIGLLTGCSSSPQTVGEKLDPLTSTTMMFSPTPLVMYRDDPAHAAHARNFASLGALEVNRRGQNQYYLWLGIWNTNHTASVDDRRDGFDSIVIFADGEPLQLELSGWTPESIGASEHVYPKPVASALDAYYRVTADQIRLIARSKDIQLRTTGFSPRTFEPWDDQTAARNSFLQLMQRF